MTPNTVLLSCGHRITRKDHAFVSSDGQRLFDSLKCLDIAEGRKPEKYGREEDKPETGGRTWLRL